MNGLRTFSSRFSVLGAIAIVSFLSAGAGAADENDKQQVKGQHAQIGIVEARQDSKHTQHPDAQWFPDAGLGLFLHWDQASVRCLETSWPMIAGTGLSWARPRRIIKDDPAEFARVVREKDYDLMGRKPTITPNEYWALAAEFNPTDYRPEVWLKKAKAAGFRYAVLTTKHHNGFALWPSAYGGFNTQNTPMKGRDLVREFVDGCRAAGLKVGFYFSGPDWHFDRDFMNFLYPTSAATYRGKLPELGPDHEPRVLRHTPEEIAAHREAVARMVRGQIEELLTRYGKIDVMWFDGGPSHPLGGQLFPAKRIRELQPGIVINPRFHGRGDFVTPEGSLPDDLRLKSDEWGELCSRWAGSWSYTGRSFRPFNDVVGELVRCRAAGVNNLLDLGPMASGNLEPKAYENLDKLAAWMNVNGEAIYGTRALPGRETASVPASSNGDVRYLYLIPGKQREKAVTSVSLYGVRHPGPYRARLLDDPRELTVTVSGDFSPPPQEPGLKLASPSGHAGAGPSGIDSSIDEKSATKWCVGHGNRFPIVWQVQIVGKRPPITSYTLTSASDVPDRDPEAWRFLGSDDGVNWTLLDERKDQPTWEKRNARKTFTFSNSTAYAYYRFEFLRVHGQTPMFQLAEIALSPAPITGGTLTVAVPATTPAAGVRVVKLEPQR